MLKQWIVANPPSDPDSEIVKKYGGFLGSILITRGIVTLDAAEEFFSSKSFSEPYLISDMQTAAEIVTDAVKTKKKICVFGDYDCDGISAAAIMFHYLKTVCGLEDTEYYIPERAEGYGMNIGALEQIASRNTELVITVDNGISAIEEAKFLKDKGITLVVTDHHRQGETLPDCAAVVDPHRDDDISPFKELCGAGVVLKLVMAVERELHGENAMRGIFEKYADLACIATIADVMPLKGENRFIVKRGLEIINKGKNSSVGLTALIKAVNKNPSSLKSSDIAFYIAPSINSVGRVSTPKKAIELLLESDITRAGALAEELAGFNSCRREIQDKILSDAKKLIEADPSVLKERVIVLSGEGWHHGVIGLVRMEFVRRYGKPVLVISVENGEARGSARSVDGFSIHAMLTGCSAVLTKFGGHPSAGGFSLPADKVDDFKRMVKEYTLNNYKEMPADKIFVDREVDIGELSIENVSSLAMLEPFGEHNKRPLFLLRNCVIKQKRPLSDGRFVRFRIEQNGRQLDCVDFGTSFDKFYPRVNSTVDIIAKADIDRIGGTESVQLKIEDFRPAHFPEEKFLKAQRIYEGVCRGEGCDKKFASAVVPHTREELMTIYDIIKKNTDGKTVEEIAMYDLSVNYCRLRLAIDAFAEAGMAELTPDGVPRVLKFTGKRDLFSEGLLAVLCAELLA